MDRRPAPLVGEGAKGIGLLDEADLGRAEREAEAVIVAVLDDAMIAERPEAVAELLDAVDDEGAHRGDVQRHGARLADADRTEERRGGTECVSTWRSRWAPYSKN